MIFDIHSHILPSVDDGPRAVAESLALLSVLKEEGVGAVVATPHFYAEKVIWDEYMPLVDHRFANLKELAKSTQIKLIKGFEVRYFKGISNFDKISDLTLGKSKFMLVEFPYSTPITEAMVNEICDINYNHGIVPILAHIERYTKYHGFKFALEAIKSGELLAHVNASSFLDGYRKTALGLVKAGVATLVASDTHSIDSRPPCFAEGFEALEDDLGKPIVDRLIKNSYELYFEIANE